MSTNYRELGSAESGRKTSLGKALCIQYQVVYPENTSNIVIQIEQVVFGNMCVYVYATIVNEQ